MAASMTRRIVGGAAVFVGVGAAGLIMAAPAGAAVTGVAITTPSGYGSVADRYGSSCSYTVQATVNDYTSGADPVAFSVSKDGGAYTAIDGSPVAADANKVTITWTPPAPGTYKIKAQQGSSDAQYTGNLQVGSGIQIPAISLGPINFDLPFTDTCIVYAP